MSKATDAFYEEVGNYTKYKVVEMLIEKHKDKLKNLDTIEETLSSRLLEVFSQIYTQENMNNLLSKKIFSFFQESTTDEFLNKIDDLADKLDNILMTLNDIDWVSENYIENLFKTDIKTM